MHTEEVVTVGSYAEKLRLVDDGFMKICNMVMDPSMTVRQVVCYSNNLPVWKSWNKERRKY